MTNHENNYNNMYNNVMDTMNTVSGVLSGFPALVEDQAELTAGIAKIDKDNQDFMAVCKGITKAKHNAIDLAISLVTPIQNALHSTGAKPPRNEKLIADTSISEYAIGRLDESSYKSVLYTIMDDARANSQSLLLSHKITGDDIAAALAAVDASVAKAGIKDASFNERSSLRKALTKDFEDMNILLTERYDHDVEILRKDYIDIYNKYKAARVIKDLGGSHNSNDDTTPPTPPPPAQ